MKTIMAAVVALMLPVDVSAQSHQLWKCDVKAFHRLSDDGFYSETGDYRQTWKTFFFDEATGLLRWMTQITMTVEVHGNEHNGTYATLNRDPALTDQSLYIKTFIEKLEKPFVLHKKLGTATGTCLRQ